MARTYGNFTDFIDFSRASSGTALRKVSYGPELVTNGTFDTDTSGWYAENTTSISSVSGQLVVDDSTSVGTDSRACQDIPTVVGAVYKLEFDKISTTSAFWFAIGTTSAFNSIYYSGSLGTGTGRHEHSFVATSTTTKLSMITSSNGVTVYDNISVKEVTFDQADGTLELFNHPAGIPRIEYDVNGNEIGLLIEEQRSNLVFYSDASTNSFYPHGAYKTSVTLSNGVAATQVALPNDNFNDWQTVVSVSASTTYTFSFYGTSTGVGVRPAVYDKSNAAWIVSPSVDYALSTTPTRVEITFTTPVGCTSVSLTAQYGTAPTEAGDVVSIGGLQLEEGSFATSLIPTSGATATRSADIADIATANFGYNPKAGTVVVEFEQFQEPSDAGSRGVTGTDLLGRFAYVNAGKVKMYDGTTVITASPTISANTFVKSASTFNDNGQAISVDGASTVSGAFDGTWGSGGVLYIGYIDNIYMSGHIKSIKYLPRRNSNTQLQEFTS